MAKVQNPLLGFEAAGQIAKEIVFDKIRGQRQIRKYAVPTNPNSPAQTDSRTVFQWLNFSWKNSPQDLKDTWILKAKGMKQSGLNLFIGPNFTQLKDQATQWGMLMCPDVGGSPKVPDPFLPTRTGRLECYWTLPHTPRDWTYLETFFAAQFWQNPKAHSIYNILLSSGTTSPLFIFGLPAGTYYWNLWLKWQKPFGKIAYSEANFSIKTVN